MIKSIGGKVDPVDENRLNYDIARIFRQFSPLGQDVAMQVLLRPIIIEAWKLGFTQGYSARDDEVKAALA